ncbi:MAG: ABC transporter ATP-binding protein [Candidatus Rokubacteria bacterium]|nr:ABC transporter ATP-binding protein [Candidatus Rokubacteria bacterium]
MRVRVEGVSKTFADRQGREIEALHDVSLAVEDGEFVTVLGPSGCGKSTLLHVLAGLLPPTRGRVVFEDVPEGTPVTSIVFQEHALFPWRTVLGNVAFGLEVRGVSEAARHARARGLLEMVGLQGFEDRYPHQLSGGMRQRVAIARALAVEPALLLMDEPFSALDAQSRALMQLELMTLWERTRKSILYVTHQIQEAVLLGDRVLVMTRRPGRILTVRTVGLRRPRDERTMLTPAFLALVDECWQLIKKDAQEALLDV